ncbi:hypothetical protein H4R19_003900, partial [Coemansia spiralis]
MDHVDAEVKREHGIEEVPEDADIKYPRQPPPPGSLMENVEGDLFWSEDLQIPFELFRKLSKKTLI